MANLIRKQLELPTVASRDHNGIEMGVLADGTTYLTGRGLAAVCGAAPSAINPWANEYDINSTKPRDRALTTLLQKHKYQGDSLYFKTTVAGKEVNAFPEQVCMAFLEYYAFEAQQGSRDTALNNYRALARAGLRAFVYASLGLVQGRQIPEAFRSYLDRQMLNRVPAGMYSCFSETGHIVLASIQAELIVDDHTVPDVSVGQLWSKYWVDNRLAQRFGERAKHTHTYPDDYPQSQANGYIEAYVYPVASLGEFRTWLDREYLPLRYPKYLANKVKSGALPASRAELLIASLVPPQLEEAGE